MKALLLSVFALTLAFSAPLQASTQAEEGSAEECVVSPAPDSADAPKLAALFEANGVDGNAFGYWHCTAYPEGHGHTGGYDYRDVHYNHAYWGAIQGCERRWPGHHCHDVHCHYDHH